MTHVNQHSDESIGQDPEYFLPAIIALAAILLIGLHLFYNQQYAAGRLQ